MKHILSLVAAFGAIMLMGCTSVSDTATSSRKSLKVLMIGNSFSISCTRQMPQIAADLGLELDLCSMYIGGCSLERHWNNVKLAAKDPNAAPYHMVRFVNGKRVCGDGSNKSISHSNIPQMLKREKWDIVTIQQASHFSWKSESYHPFGDELVATIRELSPQAEIVVQETWSYTPWDPRLKKWGIDQNEMYAFLHDAYRSFAGKYNLRLIPFGTAVQAWRKALPVMYTENSYGGDVVGGGTKPAEQHFKQVDGKWVPDSDSFHLSRSGEYFQSLVWTAFLFGADVTNCNYRPDFVSEGDAALMKKVAMETIGASSHE